jgi:NET1-associated nuclear protein 1 (U3 small nucleolar RNA-associated protein 17)
VLAQPSSLRIYDASTSLLSASLHIDSVTHKKASITSFAPSPSEPDHIYIATSSGLLQLWDWVKGKKLGDWRLESGIANIIVESSGSESGPSDLVFITDRKFGKQSWRIKLLQLLSEDGDPTQATAATLYTSEHPILSLKSVQNGRLLVAITHTRILVGITKADSGKKIKYEWREISSTERLTTLDIRESSPLTTQSKKTKGQGSQSKPIIDVVVGDVEGVLFLHRDLLNSLIARENAGSLLDNLSKPSRLHWHREAVASAKWSRDGKSP